VGAGDGASPPPPSPPAAARQACVSPGRAASSAAASSTATRRLSGRGMSDSLYSHTHIARCSARGRASTRSAAAPTATSRASARSCARSNRWRTVAARSAGPSPGALDPDSWFASAPGRRCAASTSHRTAALRWVEPLAPAERLLAAIGAPPAATCCCCCISRRGSRRAEQAASVRAGLPWRSSIRLLRTLNTALQQASLLFGPATTDAGRMSMHVSTSASSISKWSAKAMPWLSARKPATSINRECADRTPLVCPPPLPQPPAPRCCLRDCCFCDCDGAFSPTGTPRDVALFIAWRKPEKLRGSKSADTCPEGSRGPCAPRTWERANWQELPCAVSNCSLAVHRVSLGMTHWCVARKSKKRSIKRCCWDCQLIAAAAHLRSQCFAHGRERHMLQSRIVALASFFYHRYVCGTDKVIAFVPDIAFVKARASRSKALQQVFHDRWKVTGGSDSWLKFWMFNACRKLGMVLVVRNFNGFHSGQRISDMQLLRLLGIIQSTVDLTQGMLLSRKWMQRCSSDTATQ
jgi:hypothetical protein